MQKPIPAQSEADKPRPKPKPAESAPNVVHITEEA